MGDNFQHHGKDRNHGDRNNRDLKPLLNDGNLAEEKPGEHTKTNPQNATNDVVGHEFWKFHRTHSGNKRCESSDDRYKAGHDDRFSAVNCEEFFGLGPVRLREDFGFFVGKETCSEQLSNSIIDHVPDDCG